MSLDIVSETWTALLSHIDLNERKDAADTLVSLLIDHDYEAHEIKEAFSGHREVLSALKYYIEQHDSDEYEDEEEDEDQDDEW